MKMKWTEEEVEFLNFAYTSSEFEMSEICEALGRSESSIRNKAKELKLSWNLKGERNEDGSKVCSRCKKELPLSGFYRHPKNKDGRQCYCKECDKETSIENQLKNLAKRGW